MLQAADAFPMNLGFLGRATPACLTRHEDRSAAVIGLKLRRTGAPPAISSCLDVADAYRRAGRHPFGHR
jgi:urease alpha subunit